MFVFLDFRILDVGLPNALLVMFPGLESGGDEAGWSGRAEDCQRLGDD